MATKDENICIPDRDQSSSLLRISTTFGIAYHFEMVETGHMLLTPSKCSLVPRPSITANAVEGLVKLLRRMTSGRRWEVWLIALCITSSATPPNVYLMAYRAVHH